MNSFEKEIEEENDYMIDLYTLIEDIWKGIRKFGWIIVILAIISAVIASLRTYKSYYPFYTASATFTVNLSTESEASNIYDDNLKAAQMSKTFPYIITSGVLKNVIAADLGAAYVSESITAENVENTNLFTLKVTSDDAQKAYDVLQSVIKNYPKITETVVGRTYLNMIDETGIPMEPANRLNYRNSVMLGALVGFALGILILLIYALTRRTIHKEEDLIELSSIKCLGSLPEVLFKRSEKNYNTEVSLLNEKLPQWYKESIYKIRTRVEKTAASKQMKSILVTSAIQGEGKSTLAFNLALALAEGGKEVVLMDCDLRHPTIKNMISLKEGSVGLDDVLNGKAELKDAIRYYDDLKFSVLICSQATQNASEVLDSPKMRELLTELEETADYIIVDTAPSAILSDTSNLAKLADGVIFLVKQDYAKIYQILEGLEHLSESSGIEIIGCVLNCVKSGIGGYGYGYGYGYGRYGRYGYGKKKNSAELE